MIIGGSGQICDVGVKTLFTKPMWESMEFSGREPFVYTVLQFAF
jgi:hypothetical protein